MECGESSGRLQLWMLRKETRVVFVVNQRAASRLRSNNCGPLKDVIRNRLWFSSRIATWDGSVACQDVQCG